MVVTFYVDGMSIIHHFMKNPKCFSIFLSATINAVGYCKLQPVISDFRPLSANFDHFLYWSTNWTESSGLILESKKNLSKINVLESVTRFIRLEWSKLDLKTSEYEEFDKF